LKEGITISYINAQNTAIILFFIGFYGLCARRNIVKTIISLGIMSGGVILYFISINWQAGSIAPIINGESGVYADPLPQALVITAIVVGISVTSIALIMFISMYHNYGTTNWLKAKRKRDEREYK